MKSIQLYGYSHQSRETLLTDLIAAVDGHGGCVVGQRSVSVTTVELRVEMQRSSAEEFYAGIVLTGLELTRPTHMALAGLCTCSRERLASWDGYAGGMIQMEFKVCFLEGLTVDSFLLSSSIPA